MKNILITGGTGFIGSNLAAALLKRGYTVSILRRPSSDTSRINGLNVRHCLGDLLDAEGLRAHVRGHDTVFHTAAMISFWKPRHAAMFDVNVNGTKTVVNACLDEGVSRLVHTSSIAAIGHPAAQGSSADEESPYNWQNHNNGYKQSKHLAEAAVMDGVRRGLNAVIVNPGVVIGPGDTAFNGGMIIRTVAQGLALFYPKGGMNVVYVGDVVEGQIAAALRGVPGERYILGGENVTHRQAFSITAEIVGARAPFLPVPLTAVTLGARLFDLWGTLTRREPLLTSELISGAGLFNWYNSGKAVRELAYSITPFRDAVAKTYAWYTEKNLL
jgi:dihydroflavonol-4-reductase